MALMNSSTLQTPDSDWNPALIVLLQARSLRGRRRAASLARPTGQPLALAELELDRIRETWATAGSHAATRGVHVCKVAPAGYRKGADGKLEPDPDAAPVVAEVFRRRGAGASWNELCRFLDERLPRENGGNWPRSTVTTLIRSRTYLGEARGGGGVNVDAHPALVTRAEFEAVKASECDTVVGLSN
jgi:Recombinase